MKRIVWLILLAIPLAWVFGAVLVDGLITISPLTLALGSLSLQAIWARLDFVFVFQFLVAIVVFALLLKIGSVLFGFALPKGQQYDTTKELRRIQGLTAELTIILLFFLLLPIVFLVVFGWSEADFAPKPEGFYGALMRLQEAVTGSSAVQTSYVSIYAGTIKRFWWGFLSVSLLLYRLTASYIKRFVGSIQDRVLRFVETGRFGQGGSARFAGLFEEWAQRFNFDKQKNALFMGRSLYDRSLYVGAEDDAMMVTVAPSRSGKGKSAIIPNLLTWDGSCIVIDPKGTNAAVTSEARRRMGQDVFIVEPFREDDPNSTDFFESDGFNPLLPLREALNRKSKRIREDIGVVADAVIIPDANGKDGSHWDDGARTVISGLIAHLITSPKFKDKDISLAMLRDLLAADQDEFAELLADMSLNRQAGNLARDAASRIVRGIGTDEITNIISNADKHCEFLSSLAIVDVLSKDSFRFSDLKEKPTTIYLVIPPELLDEHKRFIRLFINLALLAMPQGGRSKIPILMLLDEFQQCNKMPQVERAFRLLAGYNFVIWAFFQDISGIKLYGDAGNSFISNSRAVQVFSLSDSDSLKFISEQIGGRSSRFIAGMNGIHSVPLRATDEIAKETSKDGNKQYILRAGRAPLVLEKVEYYESEKSLFRGKSMKESFFMSKSPVLERLASWIFPYRRYPFQGLYHKDPDYR